jgi:hypothetical protein
MASAYSSGSPGRISRCTFTPVGSSVSDASEHRVFGVAGDDDRTFDDALGMGSLVEEGPRKTGVIHLRGITRDVDRH